ncbi:MAG: TetR/AcrR family transcriptional regulator [Jatrophihabitans sp.]
MGLREDKKRELRERILSTTLSLFGERGFVGTRVADIAATLRISEATFFNYFPTKQAVLKSAVRDGLDRAVGRVFSSAIDPTVPDDAVENILRAIGAEVAEVFDTGGTLMGCLAHQPDVLAAGFLATWPPPVRVIAMFAQAQEQGQVRADIASEFLARGLLATLGAAICAAVEVTSVEVSSGESGAVSATSVGQAIDTAIDLYTSGLLSR